MKSILEEITRYKFFTKTNHKFLEAPIIRREIDGKTWKICSWLKEILEQNTMAQVQETTTTRWRESDGS